MDNETFEKLIIQHRIAAIHFAQSYIHDLYLAEDIVQESCAEFYVNRDNFNDKYSFKTYLFAIVKHKCIDYIRKKKVEVVENQAYMNISDENPEDTYIKIEDKKLFEKKFRQLKTDYQRVLYLVGFEGFSYDETAKIMGKNLGQIKIMLFRARRKLRTLIESEV